MCASFSYRCFSLIFSSFPVSVAGDGVVDGGADVRLELSNDLGHQVAVGRGGWPGTAVVDLDEALLFLPGLHVAVDVVGRVLDGDEGPLGVDVSVLAFHLGPVTSLLLRDVSLLLVVGHLVRVGVLWVVLCKIRVV